MSQRSKVPEIALWRCSLIVIVFLLVRSCFLDHSDQMSQRSKVSEIALWRCSLNVLVIVFVFVFAFVVVFLLVRSCFLMIPFCSARLGFGLEGRKALNPEQWICNTVSDQGRPRAARAAKHCQRYNRPRILSLKLELSQQPSIPADYDHQLQIHPF